MEPYIELNNVTKRIQGNTVLDSINLELNKGKIYGFEGKNGSGKTMLFRVISGLVIPTNGIVEIDNEELGKEISFPRSIGIIIEYPGFLPQFTGFKNLKILASIKNKISDQQIRDTIKKVGLDPYDNRKFKKYSLGMKQRLGLAQAIMEDPNLIILDEPTNALDKNGVELVREILINLKSRGKTILIASHNKEELEYLVDHKFTIEQGKILL